MENEMVTHRLYKDFQCPVMVILLIYVIINKKVGCLQMVLIIIST